MQILLLLALLYLSVGAHEDLSSNVPVLLWSNKALDLHEGSALSRINHERFEEEIVRNFRDENFIFLLQDELSFEDLSSNSKSFMRIPNVLGKKHQTFLPSVESPSTVIADLANLGYHVVKAEQMKVGNVILKKDTKNVVVIKLPKSTSDRKSSMDKIGENIEDILSKLLKLEDFVVVYTAMSPNSFVHNAMLSENVHVIRKRRATTKVLKTDCVLMHLPKDIVFVQDGTSHVLATGSLGQGEGLCKNDSSSVSIKLSYGDVQILGNVSVQLNFMKKGLSRWYFSSANVDFKSDSISLKAPKSLIHVKVGNSFVTSSKIVCVAPVPESGRATAKLVLFGIQVGAFTNGANKFGMAEHNDGFFTIPIWAGLFTALLLLIILLYGFFMLTDLKTMSRFDDPNDKPIVQNSQE